MILFLMVMIFGVVIIYPVLFQEGNPIPIAKALVELKINDEKFAKVSNKPLRYITKTSQGDEPIIKLMNKEGWIFVEQFGSGYLFSNEGSNKTVSSVQYTKKYRIWEVPDIK